MIVSSSSFSLLEGFSTADKGRESSLLSLFNFSSDNLVGLSEVLTSLGMSDDTPLQLEVLDLLSRDLSGEGSVFVSRDILRSNLN